MRTVRRRRRLSRGSHPAGVGLKAMNQENEEVGSPVECPDCGRLGEERGGLTARCDSCSREFLVIIDDEASDDETFRRAAEEAARRLDSAVDRIRVRHVVADRRHFLRIRVWQLTGGYLCACLAAEALWYAGWDLYRRELKTSTILLGLATALVSLAIPLFTGARRSLKEASRPALSDPVNPPRFDELSDGSQFARNLDRLKDA